MSRDEIKAEVKDEINDEIKEQNKNDTPNTVGVINVDTAGLIDVELTSDMRFYAGKWYDLKKGPNKVPKSIKEVLRVRGVLKAV